MLSGVDNQEAAKLRKQELNRSVNKVQVYDFMLEKFSSVAQLQLIVEELGLKAGSRSMNIAEDLGGSTVRDKTLKLISYCERQVFLPDLVDLLKKKHGLVLE